MRIVAGSAKGRPLQGPKGKGIRPTQDRVRETLFNVLGQYLDGERVLDLYAGTGALALEALSRGAGSAVLVDQDKEAISLCRRNAETTGFTSQIELWHRPVAQAVALLGRAQRRFELVFADPPYAAAVVQQLLEQVVENALLAPGGTLVIEHDRREEAPSVHRALERVDQRRFGDTLVTLYREAAPQES